MSPRAPQTFGYSGTPLVRKLGIKPNSRIAFVAAPRNLRELLGPLPKSAVVAKDGSLDFAILFVKSRAELAKDFASLRDRLELRVLLGGRDRSCGVVPSGRHHLRH